MPEAARAALRINKITDYLLSETHPRGKSKCAFFKSFGFSPENPAHLACALKAHAMERKITETIPTDFGKRYVVECSLRSPDGRNPCIASIWQENVDGVPAFITAYPK